MLKLLLICILVVVLVCLIVAWRKRNELSIVEGLICPEECGELDSGSQLTVLITNLNNKYDSLEKKYGSLQEEIQTNTDNIAEINNKYQHANNKLQAEMKASGGEMS